MLGRIIAITAAVLAAASPALAQRDNLQVFRDVQRQVLRYPHFTIFDSVHARIDEGVVVLYGKVTMPYKRDEIGKRVERVAGVERVDNRLEVLPVSQDDDRLRIALARAIYGNPTFRPYLAMVNPPIHIIVERGRVTLEGVVNSEVERMLARSIAGSFATFELRNELKTTAEARKELEEI